MSRVVYFDCASGASGDMLLGAVVDLGLPLDVLRAELGKLGLAGYTLAESRVARSGLAATKVDVVIDAPDTTATPATSSTPSGTSTGRGSRPR